MTFISEFNEKMDKSAIYLLNVTPILAVAMIITWLVYTQIQIEEYVPGIFILALAVSVGLVNPLYLMLLDKISDKIKSW